jgi:hypothetical protein
MEALTIFLNEELTYSAIENVDNQIESNTATNVSDRVPTH